MNKEFKTTDLFEAGFLYAQDQELLRLEGEGHQKWFVFEDKDNCEELTNLYWAKQAMVNAKDYADALKTLKDRLFARVG